MLMQQMMKSIAGSTRCSGGSSMILACGGTQNTCREKNKGQKGMTGEKFCLTVWLKYIILVYSCCSNCMHALLHMRDNLHILSHTGGQKVLSKPWWPVQRLHVSLWCRNTIGTKSHTPFLGGKFTLCHLLPQQHHPLFHLFYSVPSPSSSSRIILSLILKVYHQRALCNEVFLWQCPNA